MRTLSNGSGIVSYEDNESGLVLIGRIPAVPPAGLDTTTATYASGCQITDASTSQVYINTGTSTAPSWSVMAGGRALQYAQVDVSAANVIATTTGALGHAQGVILVPAAPAGYVNIFESAVMSYTYSQSAYTGGGALTINIGSGGAAVSAPAAYASSVGSSVGSNITQFMAASSPVTVLSSAKSINLVAASAPTNSNAKGTLRVHVWWKQVPL